MTTNNCAVCGQWSGRGHKCPTPHSTTTAPQTRPTATPTAKHDRESIESRVSRAKATLNAAEPPASFPPGFEENLPNTVYKHAQQPHRQPGSVRRAEFAAENNLSLPPDTLYHGTTAALAHQIRETGFILTDVARNNRVSGEGIYLHHDPMFASQFGDTIVAVRIPPSALTPDHAHRDTYDGSVIVHDPVNVQPIATGHPPAHWGDAMEDEDYWAGNGEPPKAPPWPYT